MKKLLLIIPFIFTVNCAAMFPCPNVDKFVISEEGCEVIVPKGLFDGEPGRVSSKMYQEWLDRLFKELKDRVEKERGI